MLVNGCPDELVVPGRRTAVYTSPETESMLRAELGLLRKELDWARNEIERLRRDNERRKVAVRQAEEAPHGGPVLRRKERGNGVHGAVLGKRVRGRGADDGDAVPATRAARDHALKPGEKSCH